MEIIALIIFIGLIIWFFSSQSKKNKAHPIKLSSLHREILLKEVIFYTKLDADGKTSFEERLEDFLGRVRITGVEITVEELDKVLIAASAIIPIFGFKGWRYTNIREVLLYPGSFNENFDPAHPEKPVLGMVGTGPMQQMMVISQQSLREGFQNKTDKHNTAIHEFVHLLDKTDGEIDGIPENLLQTGYSMPWIRMLHQKIKEIAAGRSDINPYGASNEAEFFAVVSEYFFERPELLASKHPELYDMLVEIFRQQPLKSRIK